ncbi:MAG: glycosyltransferase family 4 protein [Planctomycetes bacterium]|nr:glycosyltransferase family 4 protein [Planctomycetota bacterium]
MRFALLMPGTGHFYCGSCLRDDWLGKALRARGHDVTVVPLYLPLVLEDTASGEEIHMGGINMYLQQKTRVARWLPRWFENCLDRPGLLRWASRRGHMTDAPDLGPMTVSMLKGEHGRQAAELEKLVDWMASQERPDVILLSNALLSGMAGRLKQALDVPIVCTLQGEAPFLDSLPDPHGEEAWAALADAAAAVDAFVPVSRTYGAVVAERLALDSARVHPILNGIELADFDGDPLPLADRDPPTIGFLARLCDDKGLPMLVDAFLQLKKKDAVPGLRLRAAGAVLQEDRDGVERARRRIGAAGFGDSFDVLPNIARTEKIAFLQTLSVLSVPACYGESFGLYLLEAMAAGVPVVQPRCGPFPEVVDATEGGVLCEPDAASLADALASLVTDSARAQELADRGRSAVRERFTSERMAREIEDLCRMIARPG